MASSNRVGDVESSEIDVDRSGGTSSSHVISSDRDRGIDGARLSRTPKVDGSGSPDDPARTDIRSAVDPSVSTDRGDVEPSEGRENSSSVMSQIPKRSYRLNFPH